jgi:hypothetical protein
VKAANYAKAGGYGYVSIGIYQANIYSKEGTTYLENCGNAEQMATRSLCNDAYKKSR